MFIYQYYTRFSQNIGEIPMNNQLHKQKLFRNISMLCVLSIKVNTSSDIQAIRLDEGTASLRKALLYV